jgi:ethanolamine utilization protein
LPSNLRKGFTLAAIEDYVREGDISKYEKVYITSLTFTELSDIALCRDSRPVQCAVINALLCGKEVLLLEDALPHRDFAATASRAMYSVLDGYMRTILGFGVKLVDDKTPLKKLEKVNDSGYIANEPGKGRSNASSLITESIAIDLARSGGVVRLSKHSILTPSAKDVFQRSKIEVVRDL